MSVDVIRVVLADDHAVVRAGLKSVLHSARDIEVVSANGDGTETRTDRISDLIPHGFGPANLKDAE